MSQQYEGSAGWQRVLFTALFWLIFYVAQFVVGLVVLAQCVFTLVSGTPNDNLTKFGDSLGKWVHEILRFVTFNTEQRPFPFTDFPKSDIVIPASNSDSV